jgi:hypothetical protein
MLGWVLILILILIFIFIFIFIRVIDQMGVLFRDGSPKAQADAAHAGDRTPLRLLG